MGNLSMALGTTSLVSMATLPGSMGFGGSRMVHGLSGSAMANSTAYLRSAYFPSSKRGRIGNLFMGFNLLGVASGVLLAGLFYNWVGYSQFQFVHLIAAYLTAVAALLLWRYIPEFDESLIADEQLKFALVEESADLQFSMKETLIYARRSHGLIFFILGTLIFHLSVGISGPFFVVALSQTWTLSSLDIGLLSTFNAFLQVVIIFLFTPVVDIVNRKKAFTLGGIFAIIPAFAMVLEPALIMSLFSSTFVYWIVIYTLSSMGWGLINALSLTLLVDYIHPKIRASIVGIYGSLQAFLGFVAALLAGLLVTLSGSMLLVFWVSLVGRVVGVAILIISPEPPLPTSDFYDRRKIFVTRMYSTVERSIFWLPVVGSIMRKRR
jgi:MFS family permease